MGTSLRDLRTLLETVLQFDRDESRNHIRYFLRVNDRVVAETHYSHSWRGSTQIDDSTVSKQSRQLKCSSPKFLRRLLAGEAGKKDYLDDLLKNKHISQEEFDTLSSM